MVLLPTLPFPVTQTWCNRRSEFIELQFRHPDETVDPVFVTQPLDLLANTPLLSKIVLCVDSSPGDSPVRLGEGVFFHPSENTTVQKLSVMDFISPCLPNGESYQLPDSSLP